MAYVDNAKKPRYNYLDPHQGGMGFDSSRF